MTLNELDKIKIHFIIGSGRSGTTLLYRILNHNKNCISSPEIRHFIYFYKKYHSVESVSQCLIEDIHNYCIVFSKSKAKFLVDNIDFSYLKLLVIGDKITYSQLTKLVYILMFGNNKAPSQIKVIVDKNPFYTFQIDKIVQIFPEAKFIALVRDYRAYVLSNRENQKSYYRVKSVFYYAFIWNHYTRKLMSLKDKYSEKIILIKYENLVNEHESNLKKITDFIGLSYGSEMLNYSDDLDIELSKSESNKTLNKLNRPINSSRINAWKTTFSKDELLKIEFVSHKYGELLGYKSTYSLTNLTSKILFILISLPAKIRVGLFFFLNSSKIHHYLNVQVKAKHNEK